MTPGGQSSNAAPPTAEEEPDVVEEALLQDEEECVAADEVDDAKAAHDQATVNSIKGQAILQAWEKRRLRMTAQEEREALGLFTKVYIDFWLLWASFQLT